MNKKLVLVWVLWVFQVVGSMFFCIQRELALTSRFDREYRSGIRTPDPIAAERMVGTRIGDTWIYYGDACSGVLILLTTWATKRRRQS
jgi:hypothetical protein